tara:strand:- start:16215 stop:16439 length:225 start_codon:yes stop_codon:yes gene_type:complete
LVFQFSQIILIFVRWQKTALLFFFGVGFSRWQKNECAVYAAGFFSSNVQFFCNFRIMHNSFIGAVLLHNISLFG